MISDVDNLNDYSFNTLEIMLLQSKIENQNKCKKGYAWIKKIYKNLVVTKCNCGNLILGIKKICPECIAKREEEKRWQNCARCETSYRLEDHESRQSRVCPCCREKEELESRTKVCVVCGEEFVVTKEEKQNKEFQGRTCRDCIDADLQEFYEFIKYSAKAAKRNYPRVKDLNKKIAIFSSGHRNKIQSITKFSIFKRYEFAFENVDPKVDKTLDHVNAMTYTLEYLLKNIIQDPKLLTRKYTDEYILKYGVQFRVSQKMNMDLREDQRIGVTPSQYISQSGKLKGKTKRQTLKLISPFFINQD